MKIEKSMKSKDTLKRLIKLDKPLAKLTIKKREKIQITVSGVKEENLS